MNLGGVFDTYFLMIYPISIIHPRASVRLNAITNIKSSSISSVSGSFFVPSDICR